MNRPKLLLRRKPATHSALKSSTQLFAEFHHSLGGVLEGSRRRDTKVAHISSEIDEELREADGLLHPEP